MSVSTFNWWVAQTFKIYLCDRLTYISRSYQCKRVDGEKARHRTAKFKCPLLYEAGSREKVDFFSEEKIQYWPFSAV